MEKELALIFEFKNAPKELQAAALQHQTNNDRLESAKSELSAAREAFNESQALFQKLLEEWLRSNKKAQSVAAEAAVIR